MCIEAADTADDAAIGSSKVTMPQPLCFEELADFFHRSTELTEPNWPIALANVLELALNGMDCTKTL